MSESEAPLFNPDSEPEEEALGQKEPLGIIQRFIMPLGANALTVLDPSIFLHGEIQEESFKSSVQDSPRFQESAPVMQKRVQFGQGQTVDRPNAKNALGETIQHQEYSAERLFETPSSSLHSPSSPPILGGSDPQNPLRLGSPELQSPPELGSHFRGRVPRLEESNADLGGECNVFATFQTASEVAQSASDLLESSDQSVPLAENPNAEPQFVENSLTDSASTTVQTQKIEASEMGRSSEIVQGRSPSSEQNDTPHSGENPSKTNVNLQRSSIPSNEVATTQSPPILGDLEGERKVLDTAQTSAEKDVDRDYEGIISQTSDPTASFNIEQTIQQNASQSFSEVEAIDTDESLQDRIPEVKVTDLPIDLGVDARPSPPDLSETTNLSLHSPHSFPSAGSKSPALGDEAIESTNFRAPIADPTIQPSRSDSVVKGEVSTSESTESMSKESFVPSELSSFQQSIEVGESTPETTVMRSPLWQETSNAIAPQVTPRTETHLESTLLQPRLDDFASVETESSILPESPNVISPGIEPQNPFPTDLQADAKGISAQQSAKANASSKANPKSLLSKTIQFLSKAAASMVTTPKQKSSFEVSTQIRPVQTDAIQQFEEPPLQRLQTQEEATLSGSPMIAESPLIQSATRSQETLIEQPAQTETRSPDAKTPIQQSPWIESQSTEDPIQCSIQLEEQLPEVESIEKFVQSETRSPETPIQHSVKADEQSSETLIQHSVQAEGRSPEAEEFSEPSIQPETLIQHSVQADDLFPETGTSIQRSDRPETQSTDPIQQLLQSETGSTEVEIPSQQKITQPEIRSPETDFTIQQSAQPETPIQRSIQVEGRSLEVETLIEQSTQTEELSPEIPSQRSLQPEMQSLEPLAEEAQLESRLPEVPLQDSIQAETLSPEADLAIQKSTQDGTRSPDTETPIQTEIQSTETSIQHPVEIDSRSLEIDSLIQRSIQAEGQIQELEPLNEQFIQVEARSTETSIQRSVGVDAVFSLEEAIPTQQSVQVETLSSETSIEQSIQPEVRSPEVELMEPFVRAETESPETSIHPSALVEGKGRSPETKSLIEESIQTETGSSEPPIQRSIQAEGQSLKAETLNRQTPQTEIQPQEVETPSQASVQIEGLLPEKSIEKSFQTDAESQEADPVSQRSVQAARRSPEADAVIQQSIQDNMQPEVDLAIQPSTQDDNTETPIQTLIQSTEIPLQDPFEIDSRSLEIDSPIQRPIQTEGKTQEIESLNEQSIQVEARSTETSIQRSVSADAVFSSEEGIPTQQSVQAETLSSETLIEQSIQPEVRSPNVESSFETPVQAEAGSPEAETLIPQPVHVEARPLEVDSEIQRSVQPETRSSETPIQASAQAEKQTPETLIQRSIQAENRSTETEIPIEPFVQTEMRSPEAETSIQRSIQPDIRPSDVTTQQSIQAEDLLLETEPPFDRSAQFETQSPETSIEQIVQPEMRSPDTSIQRSVQSEGRSAKIPIQPSIQAETQLTEVEPSIQETVPIEGRSPMADSPIQRVAQSPTHEKIQTQQDLSPLSQPENEVSSELIASDTEKIQPISPSELVIARETTSEPLSETAIAPYLEFPQLPKILQNLSILKPLAQNTVQKIPEQSYTSSYPSTVEGKQAQSPPSLGNLGGQHKVLAIPPIFPQETIAADSIITVQKSPNQYTKIDIPPRKTKTTEVRSPSTPSIAISPKKTLQTKRQHPSGVIQMVRDQTLIPEGKEEIPLETDTSASDIAQDLETLAQTIYAQLQQRLRIDRERHGYGTGRFPW